MEQKSFTNCADQLNANKIIKISVDDKNSVKNRFLLLFLSCFFSTRCVNNAALLSLALLLTVSLFTKTFTFVDYFMTLLLQNIFIYLILKFLPLVIKF